MITDNDDYFLSFIILFYFLNKIKWEEHELTD